MSLECSICLGCKAIDGLGYSATRCGHVFHHSCISRWLVNGKVCPECREACSSGTVKQLFLKLASSTQLDASILESAGEDTTTGTWIEKCHFKEMKCQELQRELEEVRGQVEKQAGDLLIATENLRQHKQTVTQLTKDLHTTKENMTMISVHRKQMEKERNEAKKELERIRSLNQQLTWLQVAVEGSMDEVDKVLEEALDARESVSVRQNMKACIIVLKKELESAGKKIQTLQDEVNAWSGKEGRFLAELTKRGKIINSLMLEKKDWEEERSRLVQKMSTMKKVLEAKPGLPQTQLKRFIAESPAPMELLISPLAESHSNATADAQTDSVSQPLKKKTFPGTFKTPEGSLKRSHSDDAGSLGSVDSSDSLGSTGSLNFGKKAGSRFDKKQTKAKLIKSIFGGTTPSPTVPLPLCADAVDGTPWAKNSLARKIPKKNFFAAKFDPEDDDVMIIT